MARRSQSSSQEGNPLDPNYLPPHYREEYRLAIDALVEDDLEGYCDFLQSAGVVNFLSWSEIEHIKYTVQAPHQSTQPELPYLEMEPDGSSDTYWPVQSDLDAPGLDLGWPNRHGFMGPTEVTTLVNPSDPSMPSIKEQARRLITNAHQVIGVVMDMFTDVDLFTDLLDATMRNVAVYILLDEQNAHHFTAMVSNCRINLERVPLMRVRTVAGTTYFCRTGKSFKGQMMDRFLLADCRAVLSGNYSFMWSFEKIHRCLVHLFIGELVTTFDEEFRILYAQSQPLVIENAILPLPGEGHFSNCQYGIQRTPCFRNTRGYLNMESIHHAGFPGHSFGDHVDMKHNMPPFRREDPFPSSLEPAQMQMHSTKYAFKQLRMEQSFMEQGRSMVTSRNMEMKAYKRHSYAEGTHESYSSSRQFMQQQVMNNLEEMEAHSSQFYREQHLHQSPGQGLGHGMDDQISYNQTDHYSDLGRPPELEQPDSYNHIMDYLSSNSSKEMMHGSGNVLAPGEDHYSPMNPRRQSMGQPYICQTSPTQLHPPDQRLLFTESILDRQLRDPSLKQGLRKWRINSYLSAFEDAGEEGLPEPLGHDAFDEPSQSSDRRLCSLEPSVPRFNTKELPRIPKSKQDLLPCYGKPIMPEVQKDLPGDQALTTTDSKIMPSTAFEISTNTEHTKAEEVKFKETREIGITRQDSFRGRINPILQRSSRLRSSLIFGACQLEQDSTVVTKTASGLDQKDNSNEDDESDPLKTSSVVAQILEKRRSVAREPFDWSSHKKQLSKDTLPLKAKECNEETSEKSSKDSALKEQPKVQEIECSKDATEEMHLVTVPVEASRPPPSTTAFLDMNDPDVRLSYFKELAAKRKASKMPKESEAVKSSEPALKKSDLIENPTDSNLKDPGISVKVVKPAAPAVKETQNSTEAVINKPSISITPTEPISDKPDTSLVPSALVQPPPQMPKVIKPSGPDLKGQDSQSKEHKDADPTALKKEPGPKKEPEPKPAKSFPSPKFFKKDPLIQSKESQTNNVSCEEDLHRDATDTEKSELKEAWQLDASTVTHGEAEGKLPKIPSPNPSLNLRESFEGKQDTKAQDFLKKQTQKLKGILGTKGEKKVPVVDEGKTPSIQKVNVILETVTESQSSTEAKRDDRIVVTNGKEENADHKPLSRAACKTSPSWYQTTPSSVMYSTNLRDDTKVILEQISASNQNRIELAKQTTGITNEAKSSEGDKSVDVEAKPSSNPLSRTRFQCSQANLQERENLLKRIESMRKEKKVYSRFEMGS
ncbi:protein FAM83H-like [Megalops cyprinoides]|uniref:protein FAM83H-like n=1 Tax=Megalops cyprinoides TaxID=118141 RepID=UPI001863AB65|nr:protein FAM83H-like [Megalops cyprinoides]